MYLIVVVVADSSSLTSRSSPAGHQSSGLRRAGSSLEATSRTHRRMARAESRWSDEENSLSQFEMSLGVRREVGCRWEIQATRLRAESASGTSTKDHQGEAEAVPLASVGCVVERSFENFSFGKVLGGRCRRGSVWQGGGRKEPQNSRSHIFLLLNPDVSRSVMAGPMRKTV